LPTSRRFRKFSPARRLSAAPLFAIFRRPLASVTIIFALLAIPPSAASAQAAESKPAISPEVSHEDVVWPGGKGREAVPEASPGEQTETSKLVSPIEKEKRIVGGGGVSVISASTFEALETIQVGSGPLKIAVYTAPGRSGPQ